MQCGGVFMLPTIFWNIDALEFVKHRGSLCLIVDTRYHDFFNNESELQSYGRSPTIDCFEKDVAGHSNGINLDLYFSFPFPR